MEQAVQPPCFLKRRQQQRSLLVRREAYDVAVEPDAEGVALDQFRPCRLRVGGQPRGEPAVFSHHAAVSCGDHGDDTCCRETVVNLLGQIATGEELCDVAVGWLEASFRWRRFRRGPEQPAGECGPLPATPGFGICG